MNTIIYKSLILVHLNRPIIYEEKFKFKLKILTRKDLKFSSMSKHYRISIYKHRTQFKVKINRFMISKFNYRSILPQETLVSRTFSAKRVASKRKSNNFRMKRHRFKINYKKKINQLTVCRKNWSRKLKTEKFKFSRIRIRLQLYSNSC